MVFKRWGSVLCFIQNCFCIIAPLKYPLSESEFEKDKNSFFGFFAFLIPISIETILFCRLSLYSHFIWKTIKSTQLSHKENFQQIHWLIFIFISVQNMKITQHEFQSRLWYIWYMIIFVCRIIIFFENVHYNLGLIII